MKAPRVLYLALTLNPGGTERLVIDLAKAMKSEFDPMVCCLDDLGSWAGELVDFGVPVVALKRPPGFRPFLAVNIARLAKEHGTTLIHCHHYSPFVYGSLAKLVYPRASVLFTEHGRLHDGPPSPKRRRVNRLLSLLPAGIFAVSENLKQYMVEEGFSDARIRVIYNGVAVGPPPTTLTRQAARARLGATPEAFLIGTVARLDPVKNLGCLIDAIARVRSRIPAVKLILVGDGSERADLERKICAQGLGRTVEMVGQCNDVASVLPAFDLYVNSSVSEGVSLTLLEAMAAALPIVATRVGGTPEVVLDGDTGVLVPARDDGALADAIVALADSPETATRLAQAGRKRVEAAFTLARMITDYRTLYRQHTRQ